MTKRRASAKVIVKGIARDQYRADVAAYRDAHPTHTQQMIADHFGCSRGLIENLVRELRGEAEAAERPVKPPVNDWATLMACQRFEDMPLAPREFRPIISRPIGFTGSGCGTAAAMCLR